MKQNYNSHLCLIGNQRSLKTTLLQYYSYYKIVDTQLTVYLVCSEEKFLANTFQFGKLIPVYQETLQQMNVKLVKNYQEYISILGSFVYLESQNYDIYIFDDINYFIGTERKEKNLNLILSLIQCIQPQSKQNYSQVIVCLQNDTLGSIIDLVNTLRYFGFQISELKVNPKLILQQVEIIKIMENFQLQYKQLIMPEVCKAISDKL